MSKLKSIVSILVVVLVLSGSILMFLPLFFNSKIIVKNNSNEDVHNLTFSGTQFQTQPCDLGSNKMIGIDVAPQGESSLDVKFQTAESVYSGDIDTYLEGSGSVVILSIDQDYIVRDVSFRNRPLNGIYSYMLRQHTGHWCALLNYQYCLEAIYFNQDGE